MFVTSMSVNHVGYYSQITNLFWNIDPSSQGSCWYMEQMLTRILLAMKCDRSQQNQPYCADNHFWIKEPLPTTAFELVVHQIWNL